MSRYPAYAEAAVREFLRRLSQETARPLPSKPGALSTPGAASAIAGAGIVGAILGGMSDPRHPQGGSLSDPRPQVTSFSDPFSNGVLDNWTPWRGTWSEAGGVVSITEAGEV